MSRSFVTFLLIILLTALPDPVTALGALPQHMSFEHLTIDDGLSQNASLDILQDSRGFLWIATMGGLDHLNADGTLTHYLHNPAKPNSLSSNNISVLYQSRNGNLWVGTGFMQEGSGLNRIDLATGEITRLQHAFNIPRSISSNNIASIFEDKNGVMWIGTGGYSVPGAGLNYINEDGTFSAYRHDPGQPNSLVSDIVLSIWQDASGNIWAGTWGDGLDVFDPSLALPYFQHTRHDPYSPHSLSSDTIWDIFADRSGVVWLGTLNGGMNKLNPTTNHFNLFQNNPGDPFSLGFNVVGGFYEDRRSLIWIATWGGGLDVFSRETGLFRHYKNDPANPNSLHSNNVMAMFEDDRGTFWVGTLNGLTRFNLQNGTFSPAWANSCW